MQTTEALSQSIVQMDRRERSAAVARGSMSRALVIVLTTLFRRVSGACGVYGLGLWV